jgi:hypothetical protein
MDLKSNSIQQQGNTQAGTQRGCFVLVHEGNDGQQAAWRIRQIQFLLDDQVFQGLSFEMNSFHTHWEETNLLASLDNGRLNI